MSDWTDSPPPPPLLTRKTETVELTNIYSCESSFYCLVEVMFIAYCEFLTIVRFFSNCRRMHAQHGSQIDRRSKDTTPALSEAIHRCSREGGGGGGGKRFLEREMMVQDSDYLKNHSVSV